MQDLMSLDLEQAKLIADKIFRFAKDDGLAPVCIVVADFSGNPLVVYTMDGCPPASITVAMAKAYTVSRTRTDTIEYGLRNHFDVANWADSRMTAFGGGVVVKSPFSGFYTGSVGVSGRSQEEDHILAGLRHDGWSIMPNSY